MNRSDRELLHRQMKRFQPSSQPIGLSMLILAAAFVVGGLLAGSIFGPSHRAVQTASIEGTAFLLGSTPSGPR